MTRLLTGIYDLHEQTRTCQSIIQAVNQLQAVKFIQFCFSFHLWFSKMSGVFSKSGSQKNVKVENYFAFFRKTF